MGLFQKLFGKKPVADVAAQPAVDPRLAELLATPPRLVQEGPEFPREPIVLRRSVTPSAVAAAAARAGFAGAGPWVRGGTSIELGTAHGVTTLAFTGDGVLEAQREVLALMPWIDPLHGLYAEAENPATHPTDVVYLLGAIQHYRCVGGVPAQLRRHPSPEVQEAIRLFDREKMAEAARAQRARKKGG